MFEEIWLIKESLCIYHNYQTDNPLDIDDSLFAGFFSAFHSFQEEIFPNQYTNYIDFIDHRLLFAKLSNNFFLITRESIHKPLNRSILQLNNLSLEILTEIESNEELKEDLFTKSNKVISLETLTPDLTVIVEHAIDTLNVSDEQMNRFDILAVIIMLRDLRDILLTQFHQEIFYQFSSQYNYDWLLSEILSNQNINLNSFTNVPYNLIYSFLSDFFTSITKNKSFYKKTLKTAEKLLFSNNILSYLAKNRETLQKFGILDLFISKFISNIVLL